MEENLTRVEAAARAEVVTDPRYRVALTVSDDPAATTFRSATEIDFTGLQDGAESFIEVRASAIVSAELNGRQLPASAFDAQTGRLRLDGIRAGANQLRVVADIEYSNAGVGLQRTVDSDDGEVYLYTHAEPYDAHGWFTCFDQPDIKGTYAVSMTGPARWSYVQNQPETARVDHGDGTCTVSFAETRPLSTYLIAAAAGPYVEVRDQYNGIPLVLYARKSLERELREQAPEIFEITKAGLAWYEEKFGVPYPFAEYKQLMVPEFNEGAMENPGCITINDELCIFKGPATATRKAYRRDVVLHEMAHMWFGDLVTMRWWNGLWLNESFATVMQLLAEADGLREESVWLGFTNATKVGALRADQMPTSHAVETPAPDIDTTLLNFDGITYNKGASALRQLVAYIGEDAFFLGLQRYIRAHAWQNATLEDLLGCFEAASGRDLTRWTHDWLETTGVSTLRTDLAVHGGRITSIAVTQESDVMRQHRIRVGCYEMRRGRLVRTDQVEVDVDGPRTEIAALRGRRRPELLLINDDDLTYAKVRLDPRSLETVMAHLGDIADAHARALCWASVWDMTRDGELPTHDFIRLVTRQGVRETEATVVDDLLARAALAASEYSDPMQRDSLRAEMAATSLRQLRRVAAGSELQISWLNSLVSNAHRPGELRALRRILDGDARLAPGLVLSQTARWSIIDRLCTEGVAGEALIAAELRRDRSDVGQRYALSARAAMPTAAAKRWAWNRINDPAVSGHDLAALIRGFQRRGQEGLTRDYLAQYPSMVSGWWRDRGPIKGETLTRDLLPATPGADSVAMATAVLAQTDLPVPARRIVLEQRDILQRCLRAQAVDARGVAGVSRGREIAWYRYPVTPGSMTTRRSSVMASTARAGPSLVFPESLTPP